MELTGISAWINDDNEIEFVKIKRIDTDGSKVIMTIKKGDEFIVIPDNPKSMKHRDRKVVVRNFFKNEQNGELKAGVQFFDNKRPGRVKIEDLKKIEKE